MKINKFTSEIDSPKVQARLIQANFSALRYVSMIVFGFSIFGLLTDFFIHDVLWSEYLNFYKIMDCVLALVSLVAIFFLWQFPIQSISFKKHF